MSSNQKSNVARIVSENAEVEEAKVAVVAEAPTAEALEKPAAPAQSAPAQAPVAPPAAKKRRSPVLPIVVLALLAGGGWYGYEWWMNGRFMVSTDDAYIEGDIATISPKVTGYVAKVNVVANQEVKAGDVLATLDNGDYQNALDQANAQISTEQLSLSRIDAQIEGAKASLVQAQAQKTALEATVRGAEIKQKRQSDLQAKSVGTTADLDDANTALDQAKANLAGGDANIVAAQANIAILEAQRREAEGSVRTLEIQRDKAARDLSFTVLKAPYDGIVGNRSVQEGDLVSPGQRLMALVPVRQLYIDANFKETQIQHLVPGSKVNVHVDAYDDHPIVGTVESISPASGSVFSLLPPENATGNFTKVIQRVPVRIALPQDALDSGRLRAGLSVVVDVDTRTAPNK
ncbi:MULTISPECIES: HlyD family secretion protein [Rhizobium]|uniref:HlyD family secretion protein n=1 Tax=Rhizobium TaxID=379 RepID=UPI0007EAAA99|nr:MULTISPECIES: HlyD family secretion protein [Rhizobium]ANK93259.1 EmrA family multidrug resistance transporter protein [Rhizobium sp. N6212]ANK99305.1 EmrA family multidrug resistance transporter protein [Rhizobium sp. N621]ANL05436.1 EmrA family multidrug resistance transporter protein [Rhizobium esperanzae]ANL11490.1 EmrA family multidrug resistance transporter protein [Rhizobium sp. N1341]ANL23562.1 EmrA family multidrug resistance transporter protein [Rhizobium sp. N113]